MKIVHELSIECQGKQSIKVLVSQKEGQRLKRKVKTWTRDEDRLLRSLYEMYPKKWSIIANLMNDRNQNQCLHRFRRIQQLGHIEKIWLQEEDETVIKLVNKYGKNWKVLSGILITKTGKQIRERYINKLDPKIRKDDWTEEEDLQLISMFTLIGSQWSEISKKLPGRPENRVKNRFYSYIKRTYNITEVSPKEDSSVQTNMESQSSTSEVQESNKSKYPGQFELPTSVAVIFEEQAKNQPKITIGSSSFLMVDQGAFRKSERSEFTSMLQLPGEDFMRDFDIYLL